MSDARLFVGGMVFDGWEEVQVARSLEALSGTFSLRASSRTSWPIAPGAECRLELEGEPVLTGHVDSVEAVHGPREHTVSVAGRDLTADLVDCSALNEPGEWLDVDIARIARDLAIPFKVPLASLEADPGDPFPRFALQPGETAWEALERACRMRGLLAVTNGRGELVLTRTGLARAEVGLTLGGNLLAARLVIDDSERFGRYIVRGQSPGSDEALLEVHVLEPEGVATDALVRTSRALVVIAEGITTTEQAVTRAAWEATYRAARAARVTATVQGWRQQPGGALWRPNIVVPLLAPSLGVSGQFLVAGISHSLSIESGTTTSLELVRPDAFTPEPELAASGDFKSAFLARHGLTLEEDEE